MSRYRGFDRNDRATIVLSLIARDGLICGICQEMLDQTIGPPDHPAAMTIDHIVPRGDGGEVGGVDQLENLRLTHSLCNGRRVHHEGRRPTWFAAELRRALGYRQDRLAKSNETCHAHQIEPASLQQIVAAQGGSG